MSGSNVTSLHTLFDAVREKYSISLDPSGHGQGINESFKIGFNGNSVTMFFQKQFPVLLHPGEERRCYELYHVAWYRCRGTRGSLRTTYGNPMVWARSKNFFLTAVVPIDKS
ncbi:hypothetical protein BT69DRAFT_1297183 [Atractiella rhizophila]|nr:hypothetical protein BT69DRAFT_1297183 [Atractiella rhizophila]